MKAINEMNLEELAEYAVTLDGWDFMDGMGFLVRTLAYGRYSGNRTPYRYTKLRSEGTPAMTNGDPIPDLTDPATLGCVLAMVRKKHGEHLWCEHFYALDTVETWKVVRTRGYFNQILSHGSTEAHALIAALAKEVAK